MVRLLLVTGRNNRVGWQGPRSDKVKTIVALDVLLRHFSDTPASLFPSHFVERPDPYANDAVKP